MLLEVYTIYLQLYLVTELKFHKSFQSSNEKFRKHFHLKLLKSRTKEYESCLRLSPNNPFKVPLNNVEVSRKTRFKRAI